MMKKLSHIIEQFKIIDGDFNIIEINSGLINKTFKLELKNSNKSFILQKINTKIFENHEKLMNNIIVVNEHINRKQNLGKTKDYLNARFYFSLEGKPYFKDRDNSIWRLSEYIENNKPDLNDKTVIATESGKILAKFHKLTIDLPITTIHETIPDFHNIRLRWDKLKEVVGKKPKRLIETKELFKKIKAFEYLVDEYDKVTNELPIRIVHNDPKLSNILFQNNIAVSLIDPDTIMPGFLAVDFGDAVRSSCNSSDENELNLANVDFDFKSFQRFSKSYLNIMRDFLNSNEVAVLSIFPLIITLEQLIRFYTDFLENDIYYQIDNPKQNLLRSRVQIKLLDKMQDKLPEISNFISKI